MTSNLSNILVIVFAQKKKKERKKGNFETLKEERRQFKIEPLLCFSFQFPHTMHSGRKYPTYINWDVTFPADFEHNISFTLKAQRGKVLHSLRGIYFRLSNKDLWLISFIRTKFPSTWSMKYAYDGLRGRGGRESSPQSRIFVL